MANITSLAHRPTNQAQDVLNIQLRLQAITSGSFAEKTTLNHWLNTSTELSATTATNCTECEWD